MNIRLRTFRKYIGLTQKEFAHALKLSQSSYSDYESGKRELSDKMIFYICSVFNMNEEWIRTGEGEMVTLSQEDEAFGDKFNRLDLKNQKLVSELINQLLKAQFNDEE